MCYYSLHQIVYLYMHFHKILHLCLIYRKRAGYIKNFPNVSLTLFANYSRKACFLECQATALYEECGCLPYNFPDFTLVWTHINQTSCDYEGLVCLAQQLGKLDM